MGGLCAGGNVIVAVKPGEAYGPFFNPKLACAVMRDGGWRGRGGVIEMDVK